MPDGDERLDPRILLSSGGDVNVFKDLASSILSATVEEDLNAPAMFEIKLSNWDMVKQTVRWSDDDLLAVGTEVEILMGYANDKKQLIAGEITGLEPEFCSDTLWTVTVRGHDLGHRLLHGRKTRSFSKMSDSGIAKQIADESKLEFDGVDDMSSEIELDYVLQRNLTDWEFLRERASRIGYMMYTKDGMLTFKPYSNTQDPELALSTSKGLLYFSPRLSTMRQVGQVDVKSWDSKKKEAVLEMAKDHGQNMGGSSSGHIDVATFESSYGPVTETLLRPLVQQDEAGEIALGHFINMSLGYVSGDGMCIGNNKLRSGTVIEFAGLGERFSGQYYVTSTTHSFSASKGYRTAFTVRRNTA